MTPEFERGAGNGLRAEGLTVDLGSARILEGASLDVAAGEVVGLIGPNGAGKSTLLRALLGLVPLLSGDITLDGLNLADQAPRTARGYWPMLRRARRYTGR